MLSQKVLGRSAGRRVGVAAGNSILQHRRRMLVVSANCGVFVAGSAAEAASAVTGRGPLTAKQAVALVERLSEGIFEL